MTALTLDTRVRGGNMKPLTLDLTRAQFNAPAVAQVAVAVGLRTESGSSGHRIIGTQTQFTKLDDVLYALWVNTDRMTYMTICKKIGAAMGVTK